MNSNPSWEKDIIRIQDNCSSVYGMQYMCFLCGKNVESGQNLVVLSGTVAHYWCAISHSKPTLRSVFEIPQDRNYLQEHHRTCGICFPDKVYGKL